MEKMTYVKALEAALDMYHQGGQVDPEDVIVVEKLKALKAQLEKKHNYKSGKPTKAQLANEGLKGEILEILGEGMTATDAGKAVDISVQKASALLKQMVDVGEVVKFKKGKATLFKRAE